MIRISDWVVKTPSVVLHRHFGRDTLRERLWLTEHADGTLTEWLKKRRWAGMAHLLNNPDDDATRSIKLVDEMTHLNFKQYEDLRLPMLMLFVNKVSN